MRNGSNDSQEVEDITQNHQIKGFKIPESIIKATSRNNQPNLSMNQGVTKSKPG